MKYFIVPLPEDLASERFPERLERKEKKKKKKKRIEEGN